jgi:hypothetical protein
MSKTRESPAPCEKGAGLFCGKIWAGDLKGDNFESLGTR